MQEKVSMDNIKLPIVYENKITIELFDDLTGKKVEEVKTHNILTNGAAKMAYMDRYWDRLRRGTNAGNPNGPSGATEREAGGTLDVTFANPFDVLSLWNTGLAENADIKFMSGTRIGYAEKSSPYAGTDIQRGTINATETTFNEPNNLHYVFDFPTSTANGTFDTLFWHPFNNNAFEIMNGGVSIPNADTYGLSNNVGSYLAVYNNIAYVVSGSYSTTIYEWDVHLLKNGTYSKTTNISAIIGSGKYITGLFVDASYIWVLTIDSKIYKIDKTTYTLVSTITISNIPTGYCQSTGTCGGLATYSGNFYATFYKSGANTLLVTINSSGAVTSTKDIGSSTVTRNMSIRDTSLYLTALLLASNWTTDNCGIFDLTNSLNRLGNFVNHTVSCGAVAGIAYDPVKQCWVAGTISWSNPNSYPGIVPCYLIPPGAMANVSPAVTKTATNTMKIQYDFNIELAVF